MSRSRRSPERVSPLQQTVTAALDDMKAVNVKVLDVRGLTDIADTMVIASGNSDRHVRSIADNEVRLNLDRVGRIRAHGQPEPQKAADVGAVHRGKAPDDDLQHRVPGGQRSLSRGTPRGRRGADRSTVTVIDC